MKNRYVYTKTKIKKKRKVDQNFIFLRELYSQKTYCSITAFSTKKFKAVSL
jgi:hypothetical protein